MTDRAELPARLRADAECVTSPVLTNWPDTSLPRAISDDMREAAARIEALEADKARLDWLEQHVVNVRDQLVYGSRDLFWSSPDAESVEGEILPSDIRAAIDKQRTLSQTSKPEGDEASINIERLKRGDFTPDSFDEHDNDDPGDTP